VSPGWCRRVPGNASRSWRRRRAPGPAPAPLRAGRRAADRGEGTAPITGLAGFVSTSRTGAKSRSMPQADSSRATSAPARPRSPSVHPGDAALLIQLSDPPHARPGRPMWWPQPLDAAALLVGADEQRSGRFGLEGPGQLGDLRRVDHVPSEQDHAAHAAPDQIQLRRSGCGALDPTNTQRAAWRSNSSISAPQGGEKSVRTLARRDAAGKSACCAAGEAPPAESRVDVGASV